MIGFCVAIGSVLAVILIAEWLTGLYHRFVEVERLVALMRADQFAENQRRKPRPNVYICRGGPDEAA